MTKVTRTATASVTTDWSCAETITALLTMIP